MRLSTSLRSGLLAALALSLVIAAIANAQSSPNVLEVTSQNQVAAEAPEPAGEEATRSETGQTSAGQSGAEQAGAEQANAAQTNAGQSVEGASEDEVVALALAPSVLRDSDLRRWMIDAHKPGTIAISPHAILPPIVRVEATCRWARALETLADHSAARRAYERCIGLGTDAPRSWRGLGRTRLLGGDFAGAESAFLSAYEASQRRERSPGGKDHAQQLRRQRAEALRELGELYLLERRFENAHESLTAASALAPSSSRISNLLQRAELEREGVFEPEMRETHPLWLPSRLERRRETTERLLRDAQARLPASAREPLDRVGTWALDQQHRTSGYAAALALLITLLLMRRLRGHGDLVVAIDFPPELRGAFSVAVERRPGRHKRKNPQEFEEAAKRKRRSSRSQHHMVSRETSFVGMRPGLYYVVINGVLQDPENDEVLLNPFEERAIEIARGETTRIEFDVQPRECPVDVRVLWDRQPAEDAAVAARGLPQSMRFTRAGRVRLRLCKGNHTIVVGSGDRVAERDVEVASFQPTNVSIDLAGSEGVVFKGCPPAVKPYLHGDLNAAARALARDGHNEIANLLLARLQRDQGQLERAADYFHAAGHPLEAAELRASLADYAGAALLYSEANDLQRAAQMFRAAGEWTRAGETYEMIRDLENAAECYRESGETALWLDALEKNGNYFEAAQISLDQSDRARAIRLLQMVGINDLHYGEACELLADAFEHEGHADLAVQKLEQRMAAGGSSPDLHFRLADLLEHAGEFDRSLEVFQKLREEAPTFPNVATRIETLRKKITARELNESRGKTRGAATSTPTAFLSEKRYEIMSEIGRGGMGVVFRAKDLRLDREVALKRLPENLRDHPKAIQLFLREAQACARLNHRNIVTIFDTDQEDGNFFITMELLNGYPLNVIRRKKGRLSSRDAARIGMQVADGLHYAHEANIVHRDIKTANLFFTTDKVVKIMDFGLAKMIEEVRRGTTVLGGTPYYMAPEQAAGEQVDHRADIYALGVTLYELATGTVPFTDGDVAYHHRHTEPPNPREKFEDIPISMAELILDMLAKNPEQRVASALDVWQRLQLIADPA